MDGTLDYVYVRHGHSVQEPGVDEFYKMVQKHWGKLLPNISKGPVLQVIDLESPMGKRPNVKREIPEIIDIPDEDDAKLEEMELKSLSEENLSVEEIQEKIEYLRCLYMQIKQNLL